ncbi:unnamed protein product [Auanema sp. JU1783]|nr:unnamed protein product [Auanema sp. JU1783]
MAYDAVTEAHERLKETSDLLKETIDMKRVHKLASSNGRLTYDRMIMHERHLFPDIRVRRDVAKYLYARNTIMKLWYSKPHVELTLGKVLSQLSRLKHDVVLVSRVHSYLIRYGYINFGLFRFIIEPKLRCDKKVIIVGAGLAGLSAAQQLLKCGIDVVVLEANTRVGGRIYTASHQRVGGGRDFADLGAATVRSIKANPLGTLLAQLSCTPFSISNKIPLYNSKGMIQSSVRNTLMKHLFNHVIKLIGQANSEEAMIDGDGKELDLERSVFNMIQALEIENQYTRNKYWHTFGDKLTEILQANDDKNSELALSKCPPSVSSIQIIPQKSENLTQAEIEARRYVDELNSKTQERREKEEAAANEQRKKNDYSRRCAPAEQYIVEQDMKLLNYHKAVYEGNHGAPLSFLSSKFSYMHEQYRRDNNNIEVKEGLGYLMKKMASRLENKIELGIKVTEIDYSREGAVNVKYKKKGSDEVFFVMQGACVLVTVPLGVLKEVAENKKDCMKFVPPLPQLKLEAIKAMGWGHVNKVSLWFDEQFWSTTAHCFGYLNEEPVERGNMYFFTSAPGSLVLTAMLSGKSAEFEKGDEDMMKDCLHVLKNIFGEKKVPTPLKCVVSRWHQDPNIRGAMSYLRPGTSPRVCDLLARTLYTMSDDDKDLRSKVYFAGEHTSRDFLGTLEGAYYSGVREAAKIIGGILGSPFKHLPEFVDLFKKAAEYTPNTEDKPESEDSSSSTLPSDTGEKVRACSSPNNVVDDTTKNAQPLSNPTECESVKNSFSSSPKLVLEVENVEASMFIKEPEKKSLSPKRNTDPQVESVGRGLLSKIEADFQKEVVISCATEGADEMKCKHQSATSSSNGNHQEIISSVRKSVEKDSEEAHSSRIEDVEKMEVDQPERVPLKMRIDKRSMTKELILRLSSKPEASKVYTDTSSSLPSTPEVDSPNLSIDRTEEFATPELPDPANRKTRKRSNSRVQIENKTNNEDSPTLSSDTSMEMEQIPTTRGRSQKVALATSDGTLDPDGNCIWGGRKILKPRKCAQESVEKTKVMQRPAKKQAKKAAASKASKKVQVVQEEKPFVDPPIYGISPIGNRKIIPTKEDEERDQRNSNPGRVNYFPAWFTEGSKFLFKKPVGCIEIEPEREFDVVLEDPCFVSLRRGKVRVEINQEIEETPKKRNLCEDCKKTCPKTPVTTPEMPKEKKRDVLKQRAARTKAEKLISESRGLEKKKRNIRRTSFTTCRVISDRSSFKRRKTSGFEVMNSPPTVVDDLIILSSSPCEETISTDFTKSYRAFSSPPRTFSNIPAVSSSSRAFSSSPRVLSSSTVHSKLSSVVGGFSEDPITFPTALSNSSDYNSSTVLSSPPRAFSSSPKNLASPEKALSNSSRSSSNSSRGTVSPAKAMSSPPKTQHSPTTVSSPSRAFSSSPRDLQTPSKVSRSPTVISSPSRTYISSPRNIRNLSLERNEALVEGDVDMELDVSAYEEIETTYFENQNHHRNNFEDNIVSPQGVEEEMRNENTALMLDVSAYEEVETTDESNSKHDEYTETGAPADLPYYDGVTELTMLELENVSNNNTEYCGDNINAKKDLSDSHEDPTDDSESTESSSESDKSDEPDDLYSSELTFDVSAYEEVETTDLNGVSLSRDGSENDEMYYSPNAEPSNVNAEINYAENTTVGFESQTAGESTNTNSSNALNLILSAYGEDDLETTSSDSVLSSPDESILDEQLQDDETTIIVPDFEPQN